ncbi:hypothetical protein T492DRAFT_850807 [Pavlovales sp. CCMP2436]|nr:hypothetical protein T492DRAFT_850807 [Pavlovales sp. CCMP2436]
MNLLQPLRLFNQILPQTIAAGWFLDVAIPICAGILSPQGMMKNLPSSQLKDDLILTITTSPLPRWGRIARGVLSVANAEAQISISKVIYQRSMLHVDGRVDEAIYKPLKNQTFTIPCTDIRRYSQTITASTGAIINISARFKSVKQIFCVFSPSGEFVPINSSGMNGASSTFVNGDGYLHAAGLEETMFHLLRWIEFSNTGSVQLEVDGTFPNFVTNVFLIYDKVLTVQKGLISYKK